jgi:nucleotide-binding universal stress UspA family protein
MLDLQEVTLSENEFYQQEKAVFFLKLAEKKFKEFLNKDFLKGVKVVPIIKHYKVFSEINIISKEVDADLIVMGSHGASGLKEFFIGSNTEKVVRYANIPVLVIKNEMVNTDFSDIVVASDFSEESIPAFRKMLKTVDVLNARKHLLYVNLPNENFKTTSEMEKKAHDFLLEAEGNTDRLINVNYVCDRSIEKGILNFSNAVGADLISVITHGRKGLSHIFSGSIAEDITNHSTLPIITFKM